MNADYAEINKDWDEIDAFAVANNITFPENLHASRATVQGFVATNTVRITFVFLSVTTGTSSAFRVNPVRVSALSRLARLGFPLSLFVATLTTQGVTAEFVVGGLLYCIFWASITWLSTIGAVAFAKAADVRAHPSSFVPYRAHTSRAHAHC